MGNTVAAKGANQATPNKPWTVFDNLKKAGRMAGIFLETEKAETNFFSSIAKQLPAESMADPFAYAAVKEQSKKAAQKKINFAKLQKSLKESSWGIIAQLPACCRPGKKLVFN